MKCLTCQTELPDTATSCPRCGTPTRAATSFSYLPAGAPPWPATVSGTATAVKPTVEPLAPSKARNITDAKPKRSVGSFFGALLLLILSVVIGVGATLAVLAANGSLAVPGITSNQPAGHPVAPSPTVIATAGPGTPAATPTIGAQGNQLPTPSSFVIVTLTDAGLSLKYPADWVEEKPQITANFAGVELHPQQQLGIDFVVQRFSTSGSAQFKSLDDLNQSILQPSAAETPNIHGFKQIPSANPHPVIAGVQWTEADASYIVNSSGLLFHRVSISVKHNNLYYNIFYYAPDIVYAEAMQKYYSPMLVSFQFLS